MAATPFEVAKDWFFSAHGDPKMTARFKATFKECAASSMEKGGTDSLTSGAKNGISMQKSIELSEPGRLRALRWTVQWLDLGYIPSTRSLGRF